MTDPYKSIGNYYKELSTIGYPSPGELPRIQPTQELPPVVQSPDTITPTGPNDIGIFLKHVMDMAGKIRKQYQLPPQSPALELPTALGAPSGAIKGGFNRLNQITQPAVMAPTTPKIPPIAGAVMRGLVGAAGGGAVKTVANKINPARQGVNQKFNSVRSNLTNAIIQRLLGQLR
jgi:hypothetical protein